MMRFLKTANAPVKLGYGIGAVPKWTLWLFVAFAVMIYLEEMGGAAQIDWYLEFIKEVIGF